MHNSPYIKTLRQRRAVEALLNCASVLVKDIGPIIGALNPRQIILELRRQGFEKIILTSRYRLKDRDGITCNPGSYHIPEELRLVAKAAVKKYITSTKGIAEVIKIQSHNYSNGGV